MSIAALEIARAGTYEFECLEELSVKHFPPLDTPCG